MAVGEPTHRPEHLDPGAAVGVHSHVHVVHGAVLKKTVQHATNEVLAPMTPTIDDCRNVDHWLRGREGEFGEVLVHSQHGARQRSAARDGVLHVLQDARRGAARLFRRTGTLRQQRAVKHRVNLPRDRKAGSQNGKGVRGGAFERRNRGSAQLLVALAPPTPHVVLDILNSFPAVITPHFTQLVPSNRK